MNLLNLNFFSYLQFLSMKIAAVNPRLDFNIEGLVAKDVSRYLKRMHCSCEISVCPA